MGGVEAPPVIGHFGGVEPVVKPTLKGRFLVLKAKGKPDKWLCLQNYESGA